jgi:hypothetical protein
MSNRILEHTMCIQIVKRAYQQCLWTAHPLNLKLPGHHEGDVQLSKLLDFFWFNGFMMGGTESFFIIIF